MATQGGPAMNVVVDTSPGAQVEGGSAIPVAVVTGRAVTGNKATRVVVVTNPDHIEGGPAIPVVAAPAGDPVEGGPAMRVYVVSGSLGGAAPVNTSPPEISGVLAPGQTLTGNHGTWTGSPTSYTYRWLRDGVAIGGATAQTYTLAAADAGTVITFEETPTGPGGTGAPATSAGVAISSLHASLIGYWKMDEVSGNALDSTANSLTLTDTNTVGTAAGKINTARQFNAAGSRYLSRASESLLQTGDIDFTWSAWVYLDSKATFRIVLAKAASTTIATSEYIMYYDSSVDRFRFGVGDGSTIGNAQADNFGSPSINTWYFLVGWHDATANTVNIQVNNGTANSVAQATAGGYTNAAALNIGARAAGNLPMDGRIDEIGFWKRVLTAAERTALYAGGAGLTWPF